MRVTSVELYSGNSTTPVVLSFRDQRNLNPFNIVAMVGLDADELVASYAGTSINSDDTYFNVSLKSRTVAMRVNLNPRFKSGETYSSLRDSLYRTIFSSRTARVRLIFKDGDNAVAALVGKISKLEAEHFTKSPSVIITISPDDPMLKSPERFDFDVVGQDPKFLSVTDELSTAPHGFELEVRFVEPGFTYFILSDTSLSWVFWVTSGYLGPFLVNDIISISSENNNKRVDLIRGNDRKSLVSNVIQRSQWPLIFPGLNEFTCSGGIEWIRMSHHNTYWGV